jgi:murein DD-endopeptidase MepM/ murein hydrolase activator NlpD
MTVRRCGALAVFATLVLAASPVAAAPCWTPPVDGPVVEPYRAPACTYCPGHRGIDFSSRPGQAVRAVAAGLVSFAGSVVGTRYVVVDHGDGLRATYGRLATVRVRRGSPIAAGDVIGTTTDTLYFGLRRGVAPDDDPVDPTSMLGIRRYPARLVPTDGTRAPSPGPGRLVCRNPSLGR